MYVGQTVCSLKKRKCEHISRAKLHRDDYYFHNAIRKYGGYNFEWETIHECNNIDKLNRLEIFYIGYYNTFGREHGYNLTLGGGGSIGYKHTKKSLKKISVNRKGKCVGKDNHMYGVHKYGKDAPHFGMKHSVETIKKMSEAATGRVGLSGKDNPAAKVVVIDNKYFDTLKEAAEFLGFTPSSVIYRIKHKTKWMDYNYRC